MPDYNLTSKVPADKTLRQLMETFDKWPDAEFLHARNLKDGRNTAEIVFEFRGEPVRVQYGLQWVYKDNLRALYLTVEDIRLAYKRGLGDILTNTVSQMLQLWAAAQHRDPYEFLGVRADTPLEDIEAMYKIKAKRAHPDAGGSNEQMRELNDAIERIREKHR